MTATPQDRAKQSGHIPIRDELALVCHDCGRRVADAYMIGPCPQCGSPRTSEEQPSTMHQLRRLRERLNVTQLELSEELGISNATLSLWEAGEVEPTTNTHRIRKTIFRLASSAGGDK